MTSKTAQLADLERRRANLLRIYGSGVQRTDNPRLGSAQFRSLSELDRALSRIDAEISQETSGSPRPPRRITLMPDKGI